MAYPPFVGEKLSGSRSPIYPINGSNWEVKMLTFETPLGTFTGTGQAIIVDPGINPETIIDLSTPWSVQVDWTLAANFPIAWLPGSWRVQAFLERIGPDPDLIVNAAPLVVPFVGAAYNVNIAPDLGLALLPGLYRLAVSITYVDSLNDPKPTAAFQDGPTLQFFQD
jgi:hypothetical protein